MYPAWEWSFVLCPSMVYIIPNMGIIYKLSFPSCTQHGNETLFYAHPWSISYPIWELYIKFHSHRVPSMGMKLCFMPICGLYHTQYGNYINFHSHHVPSMGMKLSLIPINDLLHTRYRNWKKFHSHQCSITFPVWELTEVSFPWIFYFIPLLGTESS